MAQTAKTDDDHARPASGLTEGLSSLIARLSSARSMEEVTAAVTQAVRRLLGADGATFVLRDADRCHYADEDAISPLWKGQRFPMRSCVSGWCMSHGQPAVIPDVYRDARIPADLYRPTFVRSLIMAPVRRDHPIGALGAYWSDVREMLPEEVELLQAIADSTALSIAFLDLQRARTLSPPAPASAGRPPVALHADQPATPESAELGARLRRYAHDGLQPGSLLAYGAALACVLGAVGFRLGLDAVGLADTPPFAPFFLAVVAATVVAGARAGVLALVVGGLVAAAVFVPGGSVTDPIPRSLFGAALFLATGGMIVWLFTRYRRALARFTAEDARRVLLARELQHRTRNSLAVAEAIVRQSLPSHPEQARLIAERLRVGLAPLDLQQSGADAPSSLRGLLAAELAAFDLSRFALEGEDDAPVPPELRTVLTLLAHELATNALKHGALSVSEGRVAVTWWIAGQRRWLRWSEYGGPRVEAPQRRGYGTLFLRRLMQGVDGVIRTEFRPAGLVAEISLPLEPGRRTRKFP